MILWLAGAALFLTIFYFYVNREKKDILITSEEKIENFISSNTFAGAKRGYVFKKDDLGIGYYIDIINNS
jgi:hypothetical protein